MAEGAVRFPESGRLMPKAAQSRLESICAGSFSLLKCRVECRSFNVCIKGLPVSFCGAGRSMALNSWAPIHAGNANSTVNTIRMYFLRLIFIVHLESFLLNIQFHSEPHYQCGIHELVGGIDNLKIGCDMKPGGSGDIIVKFHSLLIIQYKEIIRQFVADGGKIISQAQGVFRAIRNDAGGAQAKAVKPFKGIGGLIRIPQSEKIPDTLFRFGFLEIPELVIIKIDTPGFIFSRFQK